MIRSSVLDRWMGDDCDMTPQPGKPRVLIVDDHPANRLAFQTLLEPLYSLSVAENGTKALEITLQVDFAVILLDVRMPGMDGFEVAELLRKRARTRHTPIIFMSAYDQTVIQAKKGYLAGAMDFLFSPVDEELLKYKVAAYVAIHLRNESLWIQLHHLQETVQSLQLEAQRSQATELMQQKIYSLERQLEELKGQLSPVPP